VSELDHVVIEDVTKSHSGFASLLPLREIGVKRNIERSDFAFPDQLADGKAHDGLGYGHRFYSMRRKPIIALR
jgi:hypothetical protein